MPRRSRRSECICWSRLRRVDNRSTPMMAGCCDFSSCAEVMSYWHGCPRDRSGLDGDHDGAPRESLWRWPLAPGKAMVAGCS